MVKQTHFVVGTEALSFSVVVCLAVILAYGVKKVGCTVQRAG